MKRYLVLLAVALGVALLSAASAVYLDNEAGLEPLTCHTDFECMMMFGGDGSPESVARELGRKP